MAETVYFLGAFFAVAWLFYWAILAERNPSKFEDAWPFAMRDKDDYRKAHGDHLPF